MTPEREKIVDAAYSHYLTIEPRSRRFYLTVFSLVFWAMLFAFFIRDVSHGFKMAWDNVKVTYRGHREFKKRVRSGG